MSLYDSWNEMAQQERSPKEHKEFWDAYFKAEKDNYVMILDRAEEPYKGTLGELADTFSMSPEVFTGFMDGINTSLKKEVKLQSLKIDTKISLEVDYEKLYYNMLNAKADWLYNLPQWDKLLTVEKRKEITRNYRSSKMFIKEVSVGRNDPCPCNSGKKYKKCCGVN